MKVLVIGATGNVGSAVVRQLSAAGQAVVAAVRSVEADQSQFSDLSGVEFRNFNFLDSATFGPALQGMDGLFLIGPPGKEITSLMETFFRAAHQAGIRQIVFNSGRTTGDIPGTPLWQIEQMLPSCGIPYAILQPGWFMQNFSTGLAEDIREEDSIHLPAGTAKTAFVDVRDIAAVTETLLTRGPLQGTTYELVSDEALDHDQVAAAFSRVLGRTIHYQDHSPASYTERMLQKGREQAAVDHTIFLYSIVKTGKEAALSSDIQDLLGRPPIRFEQFIQDHRSVWKK